MTLRIEHCPECRHSMASANAVTHDVISSTIVPQIDPLVALIAKALLRENAVDQSGGLVDKISDPYALAGRLTIQLCRTRMGKTGPFPTFPAMFHPECQQIPIHTHR